MDTTSLKEILIDDFDMQMSHINETIEQIQGFNENLLSLFYEFLEDGNFPNITVEGYNSNDLVKKYNLTEIGAFMMLDWLQKDPEEAKYLFEFGI